MLPEQERFLVLEIGGQGCAIPIADVREIVPMAALARSPGQPSLLEGFLNLRGVAVPVVCAARLFDLPAPEPGMHTPLAVLRGNPWPLALLVDRVVEIASPQEVLPLRENNSFNDCARAEAVFSRRTAFVLDCGKILLENERQCIAVLRARAQERLEEVESLRA
ncbi:MAG: chemotaxis protein CheW [Acidobacteriia bacterium]|nr:chemotaxis protein CheW [Terriglobia bacterium]